MFHDLRGDQAFLKGELAGLKRARASALATAGYARSGWMRAAADADRAICEDDERALNRVAAKRERFRASHKEAMALRDEVAELEAELDEYGDLDEYGYAA